MEETGEQTKHRFLGCTVLYCLRCTALVVLFRGFRVVLYVYIEMDEMYGIIDDVSKTSTVFWIVLLYRSETMDSKKTSSDKSYNGISQKIRFYALSLQYE